MTKAKHSIADTSFQNLETAKLHLFRERHKSVSIDCREAQKDKLLKPTMVVSLLPEVEPNNV